MRQSAYDDPAVRTGRACPFCRRPWDPITAAKAFVEVARKAWLRWKKVPKDKRREWSLEANRKRWARYTPEQRSEIARAAVNARWAKRKPRP